MNAPPPHLYEFGEFRLDPIGRRLWRRDGSAVPLTPRGFLKPSFTSSSTTEFSWTKSG